MFCWCELFFLVVFCRHGSTALAQLEPTDALRRHPQVVVEPVVAGTRIPEEGIPGPIMAEGGLEGETATSTCTQWTTGATSNTISLIKFDFHLLLRFLKLWSWPELKLCWWVFKSTALPVTVVVTTHTVSYNNKSNNTKFMPPMLLHALPKTKTQRHCGFTTKCFPSFFKTEETCLKTVEVRLPKFATDIIVHISRPISRTLDLKGSAESPGIWP